MKRFFLFVTVFFLLASCSGCASAEKNPYIKPERPVVTYPTQEEIDTLNGYHKSEPTDIVYYANTKSKKFHRPDCVYAKRIAEGQVRLERDKEALLQDGYLPCSFCHP